MKYNIVVDVILKLRFESSVISYGNQTCTYVAVLKPTFESSVISYGNQTNFDHNFDTRGLRVV